MNKICGFFAVSVVIVLTGCVSGVSREEAAGLYYNLGNAYAELGKDGDAVSAYQSARSLDPDLFQAGYNLARIHIASGRYEEGRSLIAGLLEEDPENVILLEAEAWSYYKEGKAQKALDIYEQIISLRYNHPRALYNLSRLYLQLEDIDKACEYIYLLWEKELSDSGIPGKNELLLEWCRLQIEIEHYDDALESLLYLGSESASSEIYALQGDVYQKQEKYGLALEAYEKSLETGSEPEPWVIYRKAFLLLTIAEDEEPGLLALEEAIKAGYKDLGEFERLIDAENFLFAEQVANILLDNGIDLEAEADIDAEEFLEELPDSEAVEPEPVGGDDGIL